MILCCRCQREIDEHQKFVIIDKYRAAHLICDTPPMILKEGPLPAVLVDGR